MPETSLERDEGDAATAPAEAGAPRGATSPRPEAGPPPEEAAPQRGTRRTADAGPPPEEAASPETAALLAPASAPALGPVPAPASAPAPAPVEMPERAAPLRPEVLWALAAAGSYGLTLFVASEDLVLLAIPGLIGCVLLELIAVRYVLRRPSPGAPAPYVTDGSDSRGAVHFLYAALLKRYLVLVFCFLAIMALPLVTRSTWATYLIPLIGVGLFGVVLATIYWFDQLRWVRQCARVLNVYGFEFRSPVYGLDLWRNGRRFLVMGCDGLESPEMHAREPMGHPRWPDRIAEGAWFAGDEVFGGVLLVPGTGELMCMQPLDWDEFKPWRDEAGEERREKAKRAGLDRNSV
ncbi:hypothetical protein HCC61_08645 [Streptomyces sp. HNM0575]|uniref:hypothetical protein n=1 Tax=Streptomyces sp. HNM0575 TaxID=2716338 RepID=UPI00145DB70C|nr:hypothetical protein [Streptomyces sp. HNM0575]NLU72739.1 hypothetical protein [Streptomyces sp. HNM0575]